MSTDIIKTEKKIKLTYHLYLKIDLVSAFTIGSGKNEMYDIDVCKLPDGKPYIPFTSWFGVIKHLFFDKIKLDDNISNNELWAIIYFWGDCRNYISINLKERIEQFEDDKEKIGFIPKGHLLFYADANNYITNTSLKYRDAIKIDATTKLAIKGAKYDFETVDAGAQLSFNCYLDLREGICKTTIEKCFKFLLDNINKCRIGAKTSGGLGVQELKEHKLLVFDYDKPEDQVAWFCKQANIVIDISQNTTTLNESFTSSKPTNTITISTNVSIIDTLLMAGGSDKNIKADKQHIKIQNGDYIFNGKSTKNILAGRMKRILNEICNDKTKNKDAIDNLFGYVKEKKDFPDLEGTLAKRGKFYSKESPIKSTDIIELTQHRIAINHYTGGTVDGAKLDALVLQHKQEEIPIVFSINNFNVYEPMWLLNAVIDLITEDLPLGGESSIGRGRLKGNEINITANDNLFTLKLNENNLGLNPQQLSILNKWQDDFNNHFNIKLNGK